MEVDMNPDLMSHQTNYEYIPFRENTRYQNQTPFKKLKVDHYLRILAGTGMSSPMLEYMSEFFQSLVRRNLSMGSLVQYFHALKRFFLFFKLLDISRLEFVDREHLGVDCYGPVPKLSHFILPVD
jgi:hypothetical protein